LPWLSLRNHFFLFPGTTMPNTSPRVYLFLYDSPPPSPVSGTSSVTCVTICCDGLTTSSLVFSWQSFLSLPMPIATSNNDSRLQPARQQAGSCHHPNTALGQRVCRRHARQSGASNHRHTMVAWPICKKPLLQGTASLPSLVRLPLLSIIGKILPASVFAPIRRLFDRSVAYPFIKSNGNAPARRFPSTPISPTEEYARFTTRFARAHDGCELFQSNQGIHHTFFCCTPAASPCTHTSPAEEYARVTTRSARAHDGCELFECKKRIHHAFFFRNPEASPCTHRVPKNTYNLLLGLPAHTTGANCLRAQRGSSMHFFPYSSRGYSTICEISPEVKIRYVLPSDSTELRLRF
jgi:hypothetical protein